MKNKLVYFLLLLLLIISCQKQADIRTFTVTIDESLNSEPQWVYWISLYGNEFNIIDSCFIEKGQTEFILRDTIMNDSVVSTKLIFSEVLLPWERSYIHIDKNDRDIRISNLSSKGLYVDGTILTGALAESEHRELFLKKRKLLRDITRLKDDLLVADYNDSITLNRIVDSISLIERYMIKHLIINQFDSVQSTTTLTYRLQDLRNIVQSGEVPKKTADSIAQVLSKRYPDDVKIQIATKNLINEERTPPPSARSEFWRKRSEEIRYIAHNKDLYKQDDGGMSIGRKPSRPPGVYRVDRDITNIPAYKIGSKIGPLRLKDIQNNYSSIADIKTDYILIDFWAGWCVPCVQEIPNLIQVQNKYKSHLSIYAISLDNTERDWRTSIEKNKSRQFINVYAGTWTNENAELLTKSFGVTSIPANFLLDKNRQIIAINLKGNELDKKLSQLLLK